MCFSARKISPESKGIDKELKKTAKDLSETKKILLLGAGTLFGELSFSLCLLPFCLLCSTFWTVPTSLLLLFSFVISFNVIL